MMQQDERKAEGAMRILEAMSGVDAELLERSEKPVRKLLTIRNMGMAMAACLCLLIVGSVWSVSTGTKNASSTESIRPATDSAAALDAAQEAPIAAEEAAGEDFAPGIQGVAPGKNTLDTAMTNNAEAADDLAEELRGEQSASAAWLSDIQEQEVSAEQLAEMPEYEKYAAGRAVGDLTLLRAYGYYDGAKQCVALCLEYAGEEKACEVWVCREEAFFELTGIRQIVTKEELEAGGSSEEPFGVWDDGYVLSILGNLDEKQRCEVYREMLQ